MHVFSAARLQDEPSREHELNELFASLAGSVTYDSSAKTLLVGTRKDGDETLGVGQVDVDMLSNLILGRLNSRDRRLASALVMDKHNNNEHTTPMDTEHCFFCIENKRGHRGDDTVRVPPAHTFSVRST